MMSRCSLVLLLAFLVVGGCQTFDESPDLEYDEEVEDEEMKDWMQELKVRRSSVFHLNDVSSR